MAVDHSFMNKTEGFGFQTLRPFFDLRSFSETTEPLDCSETSQRVLVKKQNDEWIFLFPQSPQSNYIGTATYECRAICDLVLTDFFDLKVTSEVESDRKDHGKEKSCQTYGSLDVDFFFFFISRES